MREHDEFSRRRFLLTGTFAAAGFGLRFDPARAQALAPTPACEPGGAVTLRQTEGPFYKPRTPLRADLIEAGSKGRPVELTGHVLSRSCRPLPRAIVDLWHADEAGDYDDRGFRYRGHVLTDESGRYRFRTIVPAFYPGRTRHYHVKVHTPGARLLTTQLYFPDEAENRRDRIFRRELLMRTAPAGDALAARFDFVLDLP